MFATIFNFFNNKKEDENNEGSTDVAQSITPDKKLINTNAKTQDKIDQEMVVHELEKLFASLPAHIQFLIGPLLTQARTALNNGGMVSSVTMQKFNEVVANEQTKSMMQAALGGGILCAGVACVPETSLGNIRPNSFFGMPVGRSLAGGMAA